MKRIFRLLLAGAFCLGAIQSTSSQESANLAEIEEETDSVDILPPAQPLVNGNRYAHPVYNFGLTLPSEDWRFIVDQAEVEDFNAGALVVMNAPERNLFSMVIVEKFPDVTVEEYSERVKPSLENLEKQSSTSLTIADLPAFRRIWQGDFEGIPMRFHYTLIAKEDYRFQIVSWCAQEDWSYGVDNQFDAIGLGFEDLGPVAVPKETPWTPPSILGPTDIYIHDLYSFSITRPSPDWTFVTDPEGLASINSDATVAMHKNEEIFSMVIVENLPGVSLAEYAGMVTPSLEDAALLGEEETFIHGLEARKRRWRGKYDGIRFDFFYTLLANGDDRYQIVSWCATASANDNLRNQIEYIEESFEPLVILPPPQPPADPINE